MSQDHHSESRAIVPRVAARWIALVLNLGDRGEEQLMNEGIQVLSVPDLKHIWNHLKVSPSVKSSFDGMVPRLRSASRKKEFVWFVQRCFYSDRDCTTENRAVMEAAHGWIAVALRNSTSSQDRTPNHAPQQIPRVVYTQVRSPVANRGSSSGPPPSFPIYGGAVRLGNTTKRAMPPVEALGHLLSPSHPVARSHHSSHNGSHHGGYHGSRHGQGVAVMPARPAPRTPGTPNSHSSPEATSDSNKRVKREPGFDDATTPRDPKEQGLVAQLHQMGFTDMREMLSGIRNFESPTPDQVMIWIISQREETEEAKKMDAARLESERTRKEQARQRRIALEQEQLDRLIDSTIADWLEDDTMFPASFLLTGPARPKLERVVSLGSCARQALINLLQLEKKAKKWYDVGVVYCYFVHDLSTRLIKNGSVQETVTELEAEAAKLERGMYVLSEQESGVPIIFKKAKAEAIQKGLPIHPPSLQNDEDDEDDGIVLVQAPAFPRRPQHRTPRDIPRRKRDIIEIS